MSRRKWKRSPWARGVSVSRVSMGAAAAGAAMLGVAAGFAPAAWPLVIVGVAAVAAAVLGRWPVAGTVAASAAAVTSGIGIIAGTMPLAAAAAEGPLVLAYLLALDLAESRLTSGTLRWVRSRVPVLAAGFAAAVLTAVAAAATVPGSPWLTMAGVVAVGAALLVAAA
jgi:hypothetical protein